MIHFHPWPWQRNRLTVTLGATFRLIPTFARSYRKDSFCGFFYFSWLGLYVEYNHLTKDWLAHRARDLAANSK